MMLVGNFFSGGNVLRLSEYMNRGLIYLDVAASDKADAIAQIVASMGKTKIIKKADDFREEVIQRERLGSTGIGKGIAIPHARTKNVGKITIAFARLQNGIDFGAEDEELVRLVFLLGTPIEAVGEYLKILAKLTKVLKENGLRKKLLKANSADEVLSLIEEAEDQTL